MRLPKTIFFLLLLISFQLNAKEIPPSRCEQFLSNQVKRVAELVMYAKTKDPYWQTHTHYLGIVLPEFVTQTNPETIREKGLFKLATLFSKQSCETISIGPFQMQPRFIVEIISCFPDFWLNEVVNYQKIKDEGISYVVKHYSSFASTETQLYVLKLFIEKCQKVNPQLFSGSKGYQIREMGIKYNTGKFMQPTFSFSKINCDKKTYPDWSEYLLTYFNL